VGRVSLGLLLGWQGLGRSSSRRKVIRWVEVILGIISLAAIGMVSAASLHEVGL